MFCRNPATRSANSRPFMRGITTSVTSRCKKGSKIRERVASSMPNPVSLTASNTYGPGATP